MAPLRAFTDRRLMHNPGKAAGSSGRSWLLPQGFAALALGHSLSPAKAGGLSARAVAARFGLN